MQASRPKAKLGVADSAGEGQEWSVWPQRDGLQRHAWTRL